MMNVSRCARCKACKNDVALLEDPYVAVVFGETKEQMMCQDCFQVRMRDITSPRPSRLSGLIVSLKQRFETSVAA